MNNIKPIHMRSVGTFGPFAFAAVAGLFCLALLSSFTVGAQPQTEEGTGIVIDPIAFRGPDPKQFFSEIKIDQKLDAQVPLDLRFKNEAGEEVALSDYFGDKPVILSLVYYECPMLCTLVLDGLVAAMDATDNKLELGTDYEVVTISIDPEETTEMARKKKETYLGQFHREGGEDGWHFLTGKQNAIEDLAQSVGFRYYYDARTDQFAHAAGIMVLTPKGKVSAYHLGIQYLPKMFQFSLMDAAQGNIGPLVDQLILLCYGYDPVEGTYGFMIMKVLRLAGALMVLLIVGFWVLHYRATVKEQGRDTKGGLDTPLDPGTSTHG